MTDEQTTGQNESWGEVGRQFQALGESLTAAFRAAWENEENRHHLESIKTGLEAMVDRVDQTIREASASLEAQKMRVEMEKAAQSAHAAGEKALEEARPYLISALNQINSEMQRIIGRPEQREPTSEGPAAKSASGEPNVE